MGWIRVRGSRGACIVFILLVLASSGSVGAAQKATEPEIKVSEKAMTADQLAVYKAVLQGWMDDGKHAIHLSIETVPFDSAIGDEARCEKNLALADVVPGEVHRFRPEDLPKLGSGKIGLVDPKKQEKRVRANDPGKKIREGGSVDEAVDNGFAHGLVTLGEIRFDKDQSHAIVRYGFVCGSLCGNGGTALLEKRDGVWRVKQQCSGWIS